MGLGLLTEDLAGFGIIVTKCKREGLLDWGLGLAPPSCKIILFLYAEEEGAFIDIGK
jgi:hypothetical protein